MGIEQLMKLVALSTYVAKGLLPYRGLGTGILRALETWPRIRFIDQRDGCLFTSLVERNLISDPRNDPRKIALSDLQESILKLIQQDPLISYDDLTEKLGKARVTIRRNILQLKLLKILDRAGARKKGHWIISHPEVD